MEQKKFQELVDLYMVRDLNPIVKESLRKYPGRQPHDSSYILVPRKPEQRCEDCDRMITHRTIEYAVYWLNYQKGIKEWRTSCGLCAKKIPKRQK